MARSTIVAAFLSSAEHGAFVVQTLYPRFLGRPADPGAASFWLAQFHAGRTTEDLEVALAASGEYYASGAVTAPAPMSGAPGAPPAPLLIY